MYLKELNINGFKSFAKRNSLTFSTPITAVVGPNGSGKSNVVEAFRFVLGEQSVKSMRGKKGEDLIWGGSEQVPRLNRASVEVVFDNKKRVFPLDFDEIKIKRVIHRDGQNEYWLNDSQVRLKDVHEILSSVNVGATGHHIISQGAADRILSVGVVERRDMIEDALGLKLYQLKKQEAEKKMIKTLENISKVESLRRETAPHLKYLKKQVEKAERSLLIQKEIKSLYFEYLKREDIYLAFHHDRIKERLSELNGELKRVKSKLEKVQKVLKEDSENNGCDLKEVTEAKSVYLEISKQRQEQEKELSRLEGQISFLERQISIQKDHNSHASGGTAQVSVKSILSLIVEVEKNIKKEKYSDKNDWKKFLLDFIKKLKSLLDKDKKVDLNKTQFEKNKTELKKLKEVYESVRQLVFETKEQEEKQRLRVAELQDRKDKNLTKNHEAERQMFTLLNERRELETKIDELRRELLILERDRDDFKHQLQTAVALLGREMVGYYNFEIEVDNRKIVNEEIIAEDRSKQKERNVKLERLKIRLEELGVGATEDLIKEYEEVKSRDEFLAKELSDLNGSVQSLKSLIAEMENELSVRFDEGLKKINEEFQNFFKLMFGGGKAALTKIRIKKKSVSSDFDGDDNAAVYEEGVDLMISLPNKRVKGLGMLSGGERALTSTALIFAIGQINPPPFIILDETDAALDEANSRRYSDMIERLAQHSQLILITHNRETMSRAGVLYGITMGIYGVSQVLSIKFEDAAAMAK